VSRSEGGAGAGRTPPHICAGTGRTPAHICAGTGRNPAHICTGTALHPAHICAGTGLAPAHICRAGLPPLQGGDATSLSRSQRARLRRLFELDGFPPAVAENIGSWADYVSTHDRFGRRMRAAGCFDQPHVWEAHGSGLGVMCFDGVSASGQGSQYARSGSVAAKRERGG
jgi:hypothetical protein